MSLELRSEILERARSPMIPNLGFLPLSLAVFLLLLLLLLLQLMLMPFLLMFRTAIIAVFNADVLF